jgi:hypothetical protein
MYYQIFMLLSNASRSTTAKKLDQLDFFKVVQHAAAAHAQHELFTFHCNRVESSAEFNADDQLSLSLTNYYKQ